MKTFIEKIKAITEKDIRIAKEEKDKSINEFYARCKADVEKEYSKAEKIIKQKITEYALLGEAEIECWRFDLCNVPYETIIRFCEENEGFYFNKEKILGHTSVNRPRITW